MPNYFSGCFVLSFVRFKLETTPRLRFKNESLITLIDIKKTCGLKDFLRESSQKNENSAFIYSPLCLFQTCMNFLLGTFMGVNERSC